MRCCFRPVARDSDKMDSNPGISYAEYIKSGKGVGGVSGRDWEVDLENSW